MYCRKVEITGINTNELKALSNEEMTSLFQKFQKGEKDAKNRLFEGNIRLVLSILKRFNTDENNINDMFQIGCVGLIKAIDNFDLNVGVCFSTYAVPLILGEMRRANRDSTSIRVSRGIKDYAYKILSFKEDYINQYGAEPKVEEIAAALGIEEYLIPYCLNSLQEPVSIYTPIYNDGGDTIYLVDQIKNKEPLYDRDTMLALKKALANLRERERGVIYRRYFVGRTQTELANDLHISQAQVSRIESSALENIKRMVK